MKYTTAERAYLAGLWDADGSITTMVTTSRERLLPKAQITITGHPELIEWLRKEYRIETKAVHGGVPNEEYIIRLELGIALYEEQYKDRPSIKRRKNYNRLVTELEQRL